MIFTSLIQVNKISLFTFRDLNILKSIEIKLDGNKSKKVTASGDVPVARMGHSSDVYKNCMYVFGGWNGFETLNELHYYSFGKK